MYAGISLRHHRCDAVVIQGGDVRPLPPVAAGPHAIDELLAAVVRAAPGALEAVTVDISQVLLAAVVQPLPEVPLVMVIRIVPRAASDPALARSPAELVERLIARRFTVAGGHDLLGNELCPLDVTGVVELCRELQAAAITRVAIVGAGSQAQPQHERDVADAVQAALPDARISAASGFGGQGLVAREATVTLDCALAALTDRLLRRCERALARSSPKASLRVARGDGGYSTPAQVRALPVIALGADDALQLRGAAYLEGILDCRILLPRPNGQVAGDVRRGLVVVRSGELAGIGTELVVPTAVLAPDPGPSPEDGELRRVTDVPVVLADRDAAELACTGAAVSQPTSWLDEVAFIRSAAQLERVRQDAEQRATAIVMANGAAPGSTYIAEVSTVAVPYSPSGMVRVRVRVAGAPDTEAGRAAIRKPVSR